MSIATLGPFALPMVWSNPRYSAPTKIILTGLTVILTVLLIYILAVVCIRLMEQFRHLTTLY